MAQIVPIDYLDRLHDQRLSERDEAETTTELTLCTTDMQHSLETLAKAYPGSLGIGAIVGGEALGAMVLTAGAGSCLCSRVALSRMYDLAYVIAHLPEKLREGFRIKFNFLLEERRLLAEMEKARTALAAAGKESS